MAKRILILNGPNLNLLGSRQPEVYGSTTLADIEEMCAKRAGELGLEIDFRQSNTEGELVDWIHEARDGFEAIIINAGAYTHTSVALLDALLSVETPAIEVHLSNIHQREEYRQHSFIAGAAMGMICGLGAIGYELALEALANKLNT